MVRSILLAFASPKSDHEDGVFNDWYSNTHIHDVAGVEGVVSATRYRIAHDVEVLPGVAAPPQQYLAVYELAATTEIELAGFCEGLRAALGAGQADISPSLDPTNMGAAVCLPIGERVVAPGDGVSA